MGDEFSYTEWVQRGRSWIRRDALPHADPESVPSIHKAQFGEPLPEWLAHEIWGDTMDKCPTCGAPARPEGDGND